MEYRYWRYNYTVWPAMAHVALPSPDQRQWDAAVADLNMELRKEK